MSLHRVAMPAHCPHCMSIIGDALPWPERPSRCPTCRLIIGAGRGVDFAEASARLGATSSAAGMAANAARSVEAEPLDERLLLASLQAVADLRRDPVRRLRMLDYIAQAAQDPELPTLAQVLVTCGSWRRACQLAEARVSEPQSAASSTSG